MDGKRSLFFLGGGLECLCLCFFWLFFFVWGEVGVLFEFVTVF